MKPHRFDIPQDNRDQLVRGSGLHICGDMHLVRLETMLDKIEDFVADAPTIALTLALNTTLRGLGTTPIQAPSA